jgi:hypothetical protein
MTCGEGPKDASGMIAAGPLRVLRQGHRHHGSGRDVATCRRAVTHSSRQERVFAAETSAFRRDAAAGVFLGGVVSRWC